MLEPLRHHHLHKRTRRGQVTWWGEDRARTAGTKKRDQKARLVEHVPSRIFVSSSSSTGSMSSQPSGGPLLRLRVTRVGGIAAWSSSARWDRWSMPRTKQPQARRAAGAGCPCVSARATASQCQRGSGHVGELSTLKRARDEEEGKGKGWTPRTLRCKTLAPVEKMAQRDTDRREDGNCASEVGSLQSLAASSPPPAPLCRQPRAFIVPRSPGLSVWAEDAHVWCR